jgi:hypothetical protein
MRRYYTDITPDVLRRAWDIHETGASWPAVADAVGVNHDTLRKALKAAGYNTARRVNGNGHGHYPPPTPDNAALLHRIQSAANDPMPDGAAYGGNLVIHPPDSPAAAALRAVWDVPPGGKQPDRRGQSPSDNPAVNLDATIARRARATNQTLEAKVREAWRLVHEEGKTTKEAKQITGLGGKTLYSVGRKLGLVTRISERELA